MNPQRDQAIGLAIPGSIIAMTASFGDQVRGYVWSEAAGFTELGLPAGWQRLLIADMSSDGSTVVGSLRDGPTAAMLWREDLGVVDLLDYLNDLGAQTGGWEALSPYGVSADGSAVAGTGSFEGQQRAFLITGLPVPGVCPADLDGDGELTLFDFLAFQNLFDSGDPAADFDGDGELTIFDFLAFQNAFDAGCP